MGHKEKAETSAAGKTKYLKENENTAKQKKKKTFYWHQQHSRMILKMMAKKSYTICSMCT